MDRLRPTEKSAVFNVEKRFSQVDRLRRSLGLSEINTEQFTGSAQTFEHSPTIGIEIEMSWMQTFPDLASEWEDSDRRPNQLDHNSPEYKRFSKGYDRLDRKLKPTLEEIQNVIPRVGRDAYWEFSFLPSKHIGVTIAEVQTLYDAQVLHNDTAYATHMTVAGIDNDRDAFAFLCGLELSGGSTTDRIHTAITSQKGSWARKGKGGLLKRQPFELMGKDTEGYEFRTLVASSAQQLTSLLLTAHDLATMYQDDPAAWKRYRTYIESRLRVSGLELKSWERPQSDKIPWLKYADLLK
jgi:hypothetical protein